MAKQPINGGVAPGGAFDKTGVELLVSYMLAEWPGLTLMQMSETVIYTQIANFFDCARALNHLCDVGSAKKDIASDGYIITEKGRAALEQLLDDIPLNQREKIDRQFKRMQSTDRSKQENFAQIEQCDGGYKVNCSVKDNQTELMSFSIFTGDNDTAHHIVENFHNNSDAFYKSVIAMLIGEAKICQDL